MKMPMQNDSSQASHLSSATSFLTTIGSIVIPTNSR
jgi:hypothetical protein